MGKMLNVCYVYFATINTINKEYVDLKFTVVGQRCNKSVIIVSVKYKWRHEKWPTLNVVWKEKSLELNLMKSNIGYTEEDRTSKGTEKAYVEI